MSEPVGTWEARWHPLRKECVIIAAHRQNRVADGALLPKTKGQSPKNMPK